MKLHPGLGAFYGIWPGNESQLFCSSQVCKETNTLKIIIKINY